jgi:hypothetical protein
MPFLQDLRPIAACLGGQCNSPRAKDDTLLCLSSSLSVSSHNDNFVSHKLPRAPVAIHVSRAEGVSGLYPITLL